MNPEETERILGDFRTWLSEPRPAPAPAALEIDLATVVGAFTALRQEVNLQTKASRSQLEQLTQLVDHYKTAVAKLQDSANDTDDDNETVLEHALKPIFKAVLDALDALVLAHREVSKMNWAVPPSKPTGYAENLDPPPAIDIQVPWWARLLGLGQHVKRALAPFRAWEKRLADSVNERTDADANDAEPAVPPVKIAVDSLLVGYAMSINRLERILEQFGFEAIECVGQPFDPELMEVVDVIREEGRVGNEVVAELRRGYLRKDRVFRFAQVRVART